jgi:hypothetical protein
MEHIFLPRGLPLPDIDTRRRKRRKQRASVSCSWSAKIISQY